MLLVELVDQAKKLGFKIFSKGEGIELIPINDKASNACKNESIKGIPDLFTLHMILVLLEKGIK
jgi:hypothetical protein